MYKITSFFRNEKIYFSTAGKTGPSRPATNEVPTLSDRKTQNVEPKSEAHRTNIPRRKTITFFHLQRTKKIQTCIIKIPSKIGSKSKITPSKF